MLHMSVDTRALERRLNGLPQCTVPLPSRIPAVCRSTLVRMANAGDLFGACDQLLRWDKATITGPDGKRLKIRVRGLSNRRKAEREMCLKSLKLAGLKRADLK